MRRPDPNRAGRFAPALLAAAIALAGCATPPPPPPAPRTTVTLMPDEDGQVGAVTVGSAGGTQQLADAWAAATAVAGGGAPSAAPPRDAAAVASAHGLLMQSQPPSPRSFTLYFLLDRVVLTEASKAQLPALLAAARERRPTEITVYGHADASGSPQRNLKLSAERAQAVADWLRAADPAFEQIDVQYFGDTAPAVGHGGRQAEPLNRRAEVTVL